MSDNPLFRPSFEKILGHKSEAEFASERLCRLEDAVTDYLLQHLGLAGYRPQVLRASCVGYRTMAGLYRIFPQFPIYLFVRQYKNLDKDITIRRVFEQFRLTKPAKEWDLTEEEIPEGFDGHRGVAFLWPYMKQNKTRQGGLMVLHDWPANDNEVTGSRLSFREDDGHVWFLETLARLVVVIDANWAGRDFGETENSQFDD